MVKVLQGVRVLEVAQWVFVPATGAVLVDWGAEVLKIEHPVRGDTQRGNRAMLELQQQNILRHPERKLLMLNIDAGGVQSRRIIDRWLARERQEEQTA